MLDPRYTVFASSLDVLIDESIVASARTEIKDNELVLSCTQRFDAQEWPMGTVETYWENDDDEEPIFDRMGCFRPSEKFGQNTTHDPSMTLKFTNANIDILIALAESLIEDKTLMGIGIVITDNKGEFFNPLHPLHAQQVLDTGKLPFDEFTILFYPSEEEHEIHPQEQHKQYLKDVIKHTKTMHDSKDYSTQDPDEFKERILNEIRGLEYNEQIDVNIIDSEQPNYLITPISTMDLYGVIYPYYGIIESKLTEATYESRNLTPMCTGNVRHSTGMANEDVRNSSGDHDISSEIDWDNTCIGKYSNTEWTNLKHMNIMNCQSMYNDEIIAEDYLSYIYTNIKMSIKILKKLKEKQNGKEEKQEERSAEPSSERHVQHEQVVGIDTDAEDSERYIRAVSTDS